MRNCQPGLFFLSVMYAALVACVPVEEKIESPFDISLKSAVVRDIYDLQTAQEKDSLLHYIPNEDPSVRYAIARAFASYHDSVALDKLLPLLTDQNGDVRAMAAEAIGLLGLTKAQGHLTSAFDGRDSARMYEKANGAILEAMGRIGSMDYLRALSTISTYQTIDTLLLLGQARGIYRYSLRDMTDPEGTATMVKYFSNTAIPYNVRLVAANYLLRSGNIDLGPHADQLVAMWHSERHPHLRMCLSAAIGKLKTQPSKDLLIQSLQTETDYRVKCNILRALQTYNDDDVHNIILEFTKSGNPAIAEVAAQYFVNQGREKDAARYKAAYEQCKTWQAKARMAEAANKNMTSMFSAAKTALQKEIQANLTKATKVYEKAAWLKAWASELRNFESIQKYTGADEHVVIRTQAVQSLIDAPKDKNFNDYFAGEGHLIRSQIAGYLANAMRSGDAGILALIASAITDPKTGLKEVMADRKADLSRAMENLKMPAEMETYLELAKALKEYNIESPRIHDDKKAVKHVDWAILDKWQVKSKVHIVTSKGDVTLDLFSERAPGSVANFIQLAGQGFYNGKAFHRIVPNFVVQTGCPRGDGFGSLDFTIRSELAGAYYDDEGYVGMASAGPHTEGTQFFITHSPAPHLDGRYTIFGKVTSGMDVVHQLEIGDTIEKINILY